VKHIALALMMILVVASPASAQTGRHHAGDVVVATNGAFHPLASVQIHANKGDKFYVMARLQTRSARQEPAHRMLVALLLGCADDTVEVRSTQNIDYRKQVLVHKGRYIFEAPHDGVFDCRLHARGLVHGQQSNPPAHFAIDGANTYIAVSGRQPSWAKHNYQGSQRLIRTGTAKDIATMSFTAPNDVAGFSATADLEVTDCYNSGHVCDTFPSNRLSSSVGTRLLVMERDRSGGYCKITRWPASGFKRSVITWAQHHKKIYHRVADVPVSNNAECTRDFRIKVLTKVMSGNDLMIEKKPYTNAYVTK
jgi:hypothetical protein